MRPYRPEEGQLIGEVDELSDDRYNVIWLVDGSVHIICDQWRSRRDKEGSRKLKVLDSLEPVDPPPVRDWARQLCVGYSWLRDHRYHDSQMPPFMRLGHTWPPRVSFVKFKDWLAVVDKIRHTKGASVLFPNPFQHGVA